MTNKKKKFKLIDAVLAAVCIVLVVESAAPAAAIGPLQYFWWFFMLIAFFLPYGLINAELGTKHDDGGGLFDWIHKAFGRRSAARVSWYYWINFPVWIASLAILFTSVLSNLLTESFGLEVGEGIQPFLPFILLAIQLAFIWFITLVSNFKITDSKWLVNAGAVAKVLIMFTIGALGVYTATTKGMADSTTNASFLSSLPLLSIILFNFMGFEVVSSFHKDMTNPKKEIPKAILIGGVLIAIFYLFAAFGMSAAIPAKDLTMDSGLIDSLAIMVPEALNFLVPTISILFLYTLIANLLSWSPGINYVACHSAEKKCFPKVFAKTNKEGGFVGANMMNGVVASALIVIVFALTQVYGEVMENQFWEFFALSIWTLLASYVLMFPAFKKLRTLYSSKDDDGSYTIKGGSLKINLITYVPLVILLSTMVLLLLPYDSETGGLTPNITLIIGVVVAIVIGEIFGMIAVLNNKKGEK